MLSIPSTNMVCQILLTPLYRVIPVLSSIPQAKIERELTDVEVNSILLEKQKLLRTAKAEAKLTTARATAESKEIVADAEKQGALGLFTSAGITEQEHKIAFAYIRTLMERGDNTVLDISFLNPDSVLRTKAV